MQNQLKRPFEHLLPPLSQEEFDSLRSDIQFLGMFDPIIIDEDNNILDGHHRHKINPNGETKVVAGLTLAEKKAFVQSSNFKRRNLSPDQKSEVRKNMIATARELREEDPHKWTQAKIGEFLGVCQSTVSGWFLSNIDADNPKDARVKLSPQQRAEIIKRVEETDVSQAQIAADMGISEGRVSQIISEANEPKITREDPVDSCFMSRQDAMVDYLYRLRNGAFATEVAEATELALNTAKSRLREGVRRGPLLVQIVGDREKFEIRPSYREYMEDVRRNPPDID